MKTYSSEQLPTYQVSGQELRIHWDAEEIPAFGDQPGTQWKQEEALCNVYDTRGDLISKIIRSVMTTDDEIATINNQEAKPDEYAKYQAFRTEAKALADGWIAIR